MPQRLSYPHFMSHVFDPTHADRMYAVAVRDSGDLYLILRIRRSPSGDVYHLVPRDRKDWNPHTSYHSSGQFHAKGYGRKALVLQRQQPDSKFSGNENVTTIGIAADEHRANGILCPEEFDEVFEIPLGELRPERYRTHLSVDLTEPGGQAIITPGATILRQKAFQDAEPWIMVTLFETA